MKDHRAIEMVKVDKVFVDADLNVTAQAKFTKETPAHFCCKNGHIEILKKILNRNPEAVNKVDDEGNTILHSLILVRSTLLLNALVEFSEQV